MGAGNSLQGGRTVLAGTYLAEQMSPATFTLVSATAPKAEKHDMSRSSKKPKHVESQMDGIGCTVLPALASIDPLLSKDPSAKSSAPSKDAKATEASKKAASAERTAAHKRLYPGRNLRVGRTGGDMEDGLDKPTNEELISWLSRPPMPAGTQTNTSSRSDLASASHHSSTSHLPQASGSSTSLRSAGMKRGPRSHQNHYDLFQTALRGVGGPSNGSRRGLNLYSPGSARQRKQPPLSQMIKPIHITPECSVEALKEKEKQLVQERRAEDFAKAIGGINGKTSLFKNKVSKVLDQVRQDPVSTDTKLRATLTAMKPEDLPQEDSGEKVLEAISTSQKIPEARKQACEALRFFVFGAPEGVEMKEKEKENEKQEKPDKLKEKEPGGKKEGKEAPKTYQLPERVFYQPRGTREEVITLLMLWYKLDDDHSGRVDVLEFRQFTNSTGQSKLADKVCAALLGKKSSFTIEDMMRIVWPCAAGKDMKIMKMWMDEYKDSIKQVKTPPLLPQEELEALVENFKFFDSDQSGMVSFTELIDSGLLDKETADRYLADYDEDGSGELDKDEFCEVFCLNGYRAYEGAMRATDSEGNHILYDETLGWHIKIDIKKASSSAAQQIDDTLGL